MITCLMTCHECGLEKHKVFVRERRADEDVMSFMRECQLAAADAHSLASLGQCHARKFDLYIPVINEDKGIGYR